MAEKSKAPLSTILRVMQTGLVPQPLGNSTRNSLFQSAKVMASIVDEPPDVFLALLQEAFVLENFTCNSLGKTLLINYCTVNQCPVYVSDSVLFFL